MHPDVEMLEEVRINLVSMLETLRAANVPSGIADCLELAIGRLATHLEMVRAWNNQDDP
jgi:hypothetical protein